MNFHFRDPLVLWYLRAIMSVDLVNNVARYNIPINLSNALAYDLVSLSRRAYYRERLQRAPLDGISKYCLSSLDGNPFDRQSDVCCKLNETKSVTIRIFAFVISSVIVKYHHQPINS